MFQLRYARPVGGPFRLGVLTSFRDDDNGGGRVQSLTVEGEGMLESWGDGITYFTAGLGLTVSVVPEVVRPGIPDAGSGLGVSASLGGGIYAGPLVLEFRYSAVPGARLASVLVGGRAERPDPRSANALAILGSSLWRTSGTYRQQEDYRGISVFFEHRLDRPRTVRLRGTLGVDFLEFDYSTSTADAPDRRNAGGIVLLMGTPVAVLSTADALVSLSVVPEAGAWLFVEPATAGYPLTRLGIEVTAGVSGIALLAGVGGTLGNGPDGVFAAVYSRLGARLNM